jgi:hypothetical protein
MSTMVGSTFVAIVAMFEGPPAAFVFFWVGALVDLVTVRAVVVVPVNVVVRVAVRVRDRVNVVGSRVECDADAARVGGLQTEYPMPTPPAIAPAVRTAAATPRTVLRCLPDPPGAAGCGP